MIRTALVASRRVTDPASPEVAPMRPDDWARVSEIYGAGIATGNATFDTEIPSYAEWDGAHLATPRLVARLGGRIVGWAALAPVSRRCAYRGVAEVSVYVDPAVGGRGVGRALLRALVRESERAGLWTLEAWVFPENEASVRLMESCGFRRVGVHLRHGRLDGRWRDVLLLERSLGN